MAGRMTIWHETDDRNAILVSYPCCTGFGTLLVMIDRTQLQDMNADELRALALELMTQVQAQQHLVDRTEAALRFSDAKLAQLTHEMAVLKRWKFAARSEKLGHEQQSLLDEAIDADLAAIELELERLSTEPKTKDAPNKPRRAPLPANLPRVNIQHEPESTVCGCRWLSGPPSH
jgi:transposase